MKPRSFNSEASFFWSNNNVFLGLFVASWCLYFEVRAVKSWKLWVETDVWQIDVDEGCNLTTELNQRLYVTDSWYVLAALIQTTCVHLFHPALETSSSLIISWAMRRDCQSISWQLISILTSAAVSPNSFPLLFTSLQKQQLNLALVTADSRGKQSNPPSLTWDQNIFDPRLHPLETSHPAASLCPAFFSLD